MGLDDQEDIFDNRCCREECSCSSFGMGHYDPRQFLTSRWPGPGSLYVIYLAIIFLYHFAWLIVAIDSYPFASCWFIYLTNLSFLLLTITLLLRTITAGYFYIQYEREGRDGPASMWWILKVQWLLYNLTVAGALVVTISYWGFVYSPDHAPKGLALAVSINVHGVNAVLVLVDFWISDHPIRLLHFYQSLIYFVGYYIFNALYVYGGGKNCSGKSYIYPTLLWLTEALASVYEVLTAAGIGIAIWIGLWMINQLARFTKECCCPRYDTRIMNTSEIHDNRKMMVYAHQPPVSIVHTQGRNIVVSHM